MERMRERKRGRDEWPRTGKRGEKEILDVLKFSYCCFFLKKKILY